MGGPNDGEQFTVPDGGESMDLYVEPLPVSLVQPDAPRVNRIARVPIILTGNGWWAMWNDRIERDA
jgi:hypothetical protein